MISHINDKTRQASEVVAGMNLGSCLTAHDNSSDLPVYL